MSIPRLYRADYFLDLVTQESVDIIIISLSNCLWAFIDWLLISRTTKTNSERKNSNRKSRLLLIWQPHFKPRGLRSRRRPWFHLRKPWRSREEEQYCGYDSFRLPFSSSSGGTIPHLSFRVEDNNRRAITPNLPGHPAPATNDDGTLHAELPVYRRQLRLLCAVPLLLQRRRSWYEGISTQPDNLLPIGHTEYEYISIPIKEERKQKLAYIARPLAQLILYSSERVIIFRDGPLTLWDVELFLTMLGVRFISIRSDMNARKRHAKIYRFNNRNDGKSTKGFDRALEQSSESIRKGSTVSLRCFASLPSRSNSRKCVTFGWGGVSWWKKHLGTHGDLWSSLYVEDFDAGEHLIDIWYPVQFGCEYWHSV